MCHQVTFPLFVTSLPPLFEQPEPPHRPTGKSNTPQTTTRPNGINPEHDLMGSRAARSLPGARGGVNPSLRRVGSDSVLKLLDIDKVISARLGSNAVHSRTRANIPTPQIRRSLTKTAREYIPKVCRKSWYHTVLS